jgi:phytoene synthase
VSGRNTSFYYSFLVLPHEKRRAIVAVWDFCRAVDDAVDEAPAGAPGSDGASAARTALGLWRRELAACFGEGEPTTPQGRNLVPFVSTFGLPRAGFEAVIDGVEMDIDLKRYEAFEELRLYCTRVASAVGLICLEIFGYRNQATRQYAIDLGIALQLTNILRDVRTDLERGRIYVPLEDLRAHACTEGDLAPGLRSGRVRSLLAFECERAQGYYRSAARLLPREDRRSMVAARIMGAIYHAILKRIERLDYDVFSGTVRVSKPRRAAIAARVWLQSVVGL